MENSRFSDLDIAKSVGTILVVLGHNHIVLGDKGWLFRWIYSFHMPLFLFVSGVLTITEHKHKNFPFWRKVRLIIWPYVLVNICLLASDLFRPTSLRRSTALTLIYATGEGQRWTPLWYLPYFFVLSVVMHFTIWKVGGARRQLWQCLIIGTCLVLASLALSFVFTNERLCSDFFLAKTDNCHIAGFPFSIDLMWIGIIMLCAAAVFRKFADILPSSVAVNAVIGILCLILNLGSTCYFDNVFDMNSRIFGTPSLTLINACLGTAGVVFCARSFAFWTKTKDSGVDVNSLFSSVSSASLIILIFHFPIQNTVWKLLESVSTPFLASFYSFVVTLLVLIIINWVIQRNSLVNRIWYFRMAPLDDS